MSWRRFCTWRPAACGSTGADLGAWYAAAALRTAVAEVGHHLRREAVATGAHELKRTYRTYTATLAGHFVDLRGQASARPDVYNPASYSASQPFGEGIRVSGGHGILYDSLRHAGGENVVAYRTPDIQDVIQTDHYEITVSASAPLIKARRLAA